MCEAKLSGSVAIKAVPKLTASFYLDTGSIPYSLIAPRDEILSVQYGFAYCTYVVRLVT